MLLLQQKYKVTGESQIFNIALSSKTSNRLHYLKITIQGIVNRFIARAADHNICYYQQRGLKPKVPTERNIKTTLGHQLAIFTILYSLLQYMYDRPSDLQDEPGLEYFDSNSEEKSEATLIRKLRCTFGHYFVSKTGAFGLIIIFLAKLLRNSFSKKLRPSTSVNKQMLALNFSIASLTTDRFSF